VLEAIIQRSPVGLAFGGPSGVFELINESLRDLIGRVSSPPARFQDLADVVAFHWPDGRKVSREEMEFLLQRAVDGPVEVELESRGAATPIWVLVQLAPIRIGPSQELLGIVGTARDISAEHTVAELRKELVAVIAHDLRNPITAIRLSIEAALQNRLADEVAIRVSTTTLDLLHRSVERLGSMVNQLMDASQVELGRILLHRQNTDLGEFVVKLVDELKPSLRGHAVAVDVPRAVAAPIDRVRIGQVLTNVLDNASKYSRPGAPIRVSLHEQDGTAEIVVVDQGEGITPEDLPKLFDRFFQAARARQRNQGYGLGLYITKGLVEAHGGSVTVESVIGIGSTFVIRLPISIVESAGGSW
jgi:signal transduction histidine kinase